MTHARNCSARRRHTQGSSSGDETSDGPAGQVIFSLCRLLSGSQELGEP